MDFFSSSFNAEKVLNEFELPFIEFKSFKSVDEFEQYLRSTNAAFVAQLQKVEIQENIEKKSAGFSRGARLSQMCAQRGRNITEPKWSAINLFQTNQQGPMRRLEECVEQGHPVRISLRGRNSVNSSIQAKIVAFDKHWNLLIRDGDESFNPSMRMKRRTTRSIQAAGPYQYSESQCEDRKGKTKTLWQRHLPCSLIRGDDIVLIFISPQMSVKRFLRNDQQRTDGTRTHLSDFRKPFRLLQDINR
uniref:LSM domain-containing protein n=1 Tax=Wuchereria bancrofti TaxID=6293 RepID=A0AAF5RT45_WUCBA